MKRTILKSALVAVIAIVTMSFTTTANAEGNNSRFRYCFEDSSTTVYTLNNDGKTLTRKLRYEFKYDNQGQMIEKKAYRWDVNSEIWKPAYLLTVVPGNVETTMNYAEWNEEKKNFDKNVRAMSYVTDCNSNLFANYINKK